MALNSFMKENLLQFSQPQTIAVRVHDRFDLQSSSKSNLLCILLGDFDNKGGMIMYIVNRQIIYVHK